MKYILFIFFPFILFACKQGAKHSGSGQTAYNSSINGTGHKPTLKDTSEPDPHFLRKRLFTFFERHKSQDEFDTTDYTYCKYWGVINFPPYAVRAGHLFNEQQLHAMVFYSDDSGAGMIIYEKNNGGWQKIFENTTINGRPGSAFPTFTDWNRDGEKDITILHSTPASLNSNFDLWLVDKGGDKLHPIELFSKINSPEIENAHNHVITYSTCGCADNCMLLGEYSFKEYSLQELYTVNVACCGTSKVSDSDCIITYTRNNKLDKPVYASLKKVYKYVPKTWQEMMREKYNAR